MQEFVVSLPITEVLQERIIFLNFLFLLFFQQVVFLLDFVFFVKDTKLFCLVHFFILVARERYFLLFFHSEEDIVMKKSIVLAMLGIVLMLGLVSCQQEEPWTDGAPSDITSKIWAETGNQTLYKWASDGSRSVKRSYKIEWEVDNTVNKIAKYRGNEIETSGGAQYTYSISGDHMTWKGSVFSYDFDATTDEAWTDGVPAAFIVSGKIWYTTDRDGDLSYFKWDNEGKRYFRTDSAYSSWSESSTYSISKYRTNQIYNLSYSTGTIYNYSIVNDHLTLKTTSGTVMLEGDLTDDNFNN